MNSLKISLTSQQRLRLMAMKKNTGLSFAEIFRRAFDYYIEKIEAKAPAA